MPKPPTRTSAGPLAAALREITAEGFDASSAAPPGALVALDRGGDIHYAAAGLAQRGEPGEPGGETPMEWATRTDAASVTKIMATTAALMALVDAGEIDLDSEVRRYLPWAQGSPAGRATLGDLLEHQAGLWEWWPLYLGGARDGDALRLAASRPARYPPHTGRHYSDLDFILLGAVVAGVAGEELAAAVTRLVLRPFGLESTRYATPVPGGPVAASALGDSIEREMIRTGVPYPVPVEAGEFAGWRTHTLVGEVADGNAYHAFGGVAGHAGLFTTAADLLRFAGGLLRSLDGDGPVRPSTVARFLTPGRDPAQALGLRIWRLRDGTAYGHTGYPGVAFALLRHPERAGGTRSAAVAMVTNRLHATGAPRSTEDMWLRVLAAAELELAQG